MLRFCPQREKLAGEVIAFIKNRKEGKSVTKNLKGYFSSVDSKGPLFVEQENGPDEFIHDLRQDIFERFSKLREAL